jgi:MFS family permease
VADGPDIRRPASTAAPYTALAGEAGPLDHPLGEPPIHLNRDFRLLWLSRTLGQTAANTAQFGSLIVIVEATDSGFLSSLLVLSWVLPGALFSVLSGIIVDAVPKRWLLTVANGLRAAGCFVFIISAQGTPQVFELVIFLSAIGPFIGPAESALVPTLVQRHRLTAANAFLNFMRYVAQVAGLAILAPVLTSLAGVDALFVVTGALFAAAAVYNALIPVGALRTVRARLGAGREAATGPHHDPVFVDEPARARGGGLRVALRFIRDHRDVWQATVQLSLMAATLPLLAALIPVYLESALGQSVGNLPVVMLPAVVGMLLGLRLVSSLAKRRDTAYLSAVGLAIFIAGLVALSLIDVLDETLGAALNLKEVDLLVITLQAKAQIVMIVVVPMGFALSLVNVASHAILNERVPVRMQGRVFALQMVLAGIAAVPPLLIGGALTEIIDVRVVFGLIPILLILTWALSHWGRPGAWRAVRLLTLRRRP